MPTPPAPHIVAPEEQGNADPRGGLGGDATSSATANRGASDANAAAPHIVAPEEIRSLGAHGDNGGNATSSALRPRTAATPRLPGVTLVLDQVARFASFPYGPTNGIAGTATPVQRNGRSEGPRLRTALVYSGPARRGQGDEPVKCGRWAKRLGFRFCACRRGCVRWNVVVLRPDGFGLPGISAGAHISNVTGAAQGSSLSPNVLTAFPGGTVYGLGAIEHRL